MDMECIKCGEATEENSMFCYLHSPPPRLSTNCKCCPSKKEEGRDYCYLHRKHASHLRKEDYCSECEECPNCEYGTLDTSVANGLCIICNACALCRCQSIENSTFCIQHQSREQQKKTLKRTLSKIVDVMGGASTQLLLMEICKEISVAKRQK